MSTANQPRAALAKRQATAQARAALAGIKLHILTGDSGLPEYVATRWALTKSFSDIADVERWLDMVTGKAAA